VRSVTAFPPRLSCDDFFIGKWGCENAEDVKVVKRRKDGGRRRRKRTEIEMKYNYVMMIWKCIS
jgi:hypothetical protein